MQKERVKSSRSLDKGRKKSKARQRVPFIAKFGGVKYSIVRSDLGGFVRGQADPPAWSRRQLKLNLRLVKSEDQLEVLVHEALHALVWHASEEWVDDTARQLARVLHRLGARIDVRLLPVLERHELAHGFGNEGTPHDECGDEGVIRVG